MYVHRVIFKGVPGIPPRDRTFFDDWTGKPVKSVLLMGPNGTGKTTTLEMIRWLWRELGAYIMGEEASSRIYRSNLDQADLIAVELRGFIDKNLWLYFAPGEEQADNFLAQIGDENAAFVGEVRHDQISRVGRLETREEKIPRRITFRASDNFREIRAETRTLLEKLQLGVPTREMLPNMVSIRTDARQIITAQQDAELGRRPEALFRWLAEYSLYDPHGGLDPYGDLEGMLRNLKVRDPQWFQTTLNHVNTFLRQNGKHLTDFDNSLRLRVETDQQGGQHYIENLSSGEQQCLLLIFMVSRWLMPGGIVLIDEPDLHMHVSWQRAIIRELETLVQEKNGQIIVTSHSPTLWEEYNEAQRFNLTVETVS